MGATIITLLIVGAVLMIAETVLPGLVAGIIGACCLLTAVILGYSAYGPTVGTGLLIGVMAAVIIGTIVWFRLMPQTAIGRRMISTQTIGDIGTDRPELLNQSGTAITNLRPSGTALINGRRVDVVTEGGLVERDTQVRVVAVEGLRIVVRPV